MDIPTILCKLSITSNYQNLTIATYVNQLKRYSIISYSVDLIHSISILSDDRSKASLKTMPPYSAILSLLLQMRISSPVLKVIQWISSVHKSERFSKKKKRSHHRNWEKAEIIVLT